MLTLLFAPETICEPIDLQMTRSNPGWKAKFLLLFGSCMLVAAILFVGEFLCRQFTNINFLDNSSGLFTPGRYGNRFGNTPNFEGISFGERFVTDSNGFRIDPTFRSSLPADAPVVLILGDSVGFGPAVDDKRTIAGLLRSRLQDTGVYNGSVIGYGTFDYRNAGRGIAEAKPNIKSVIVLLCLNDVSDASAQLIRNKAGDPNEPAVAEKPSLVRRANDFLRSRSKLYLWLKDLLRDTQMVYFKSDLATYQKGEAAVDAAIAPLAELKSDLDAKGISLTVFVLPNEAQLRPNTPAEYLLPQQLLASSLRKNGIHFLDLMPAFLDAKRNSTDFFLYGDPMHLSEEGMRVSADAICAYSGQCKD